MLNLMVSVGRNKAFERKRVKRFRHRHSTCAENATTRYAWVGLLKYVDRVSDSVTRHFEAHDTSGYAITNPTAYKPLQWSQNSRVLLLGVALA